MERMQDLDPVETGEWVDSLRAVLHHQGSARATYLLETLADEAGRAGIVQPSTLNTPYVNTTSGSGISGTRRQIPMAAISSICRVTRPPVSTRVPSWRDGSANRSCWLS